MNIYYVMRTNRPHLIIFHIIPIANIHIILSKLRPKNLRHLPKITREVNGNADA